jgi:hypothetical protein
MSQSSLTRAGFAVPEGIVHRSIEEANGEKGRRDPEEIPMLELIHAKWMLTSERV